MNRAAMLARLQDHRGPWDLIIIGGGATGVGIAVDAAARGYDVLLLEQSDFGKGTSSRSTKLVHGGVRYLEQGNLGLVMEALRERGLLRRNAAHLVRELGFVIPRYQWWEGVFYGTGLKIYNLLAGRFAFGPSQILSKDQALARIPTLQNEGLRGGVLYYDGQFDDARLLINLVATAAEQGAILLNYFPAVGLLRTGEGRVEGVQVRDLEGNREYQLRARLVINATGAFCDGVRRLENPLAQALISPSQGIHLVLPSSFLPGDSALMVPNTADGRVMFAIPWHDHTVVGTTDTPIQDVPLEPRPLAQEVEFLLQTTGRYLAKAPTAADVLSTFVGIRPLVRSGKTKNTAALSRDHTIHVDPSGLLTITGGKWTTYRNMAEDCVNQAIRLARLAPRPCRTHSLNIHGHHPHPEKFGPLAQYGTDASFLVELMRENPGVEERLHPALPYTAAEVIWAARHEMARTVEDVLARRTRALFLNAQAAQDMAPGVATLMTKELNKDDRWQQSQVQSFQNLARGYLL